MLQTLPPLLIGDDTRIPSATYGVSPYWIDIGSTYPGAYFFFCLLLSPFCAVFRLPLRTEHNIIMEQVR